MAAENRCGALEGTTTEGDKMGLFKEKATTVEMGKIVTYSCW
jgi:hypothetical protein